MSTKTAAKTNSITLRGSAQIVSEFFGTSFDVAESAVFALLVLSPHALPISHRRS